LHWGEFELLPLLDGEFRLDGGAMFGVVPRVLWEKEQVPDSKNRLTLAIRALLVKTPEKNFLIDAGIGEDLAPKWMENYAVVRRAPLEQLLSDQGVGPGDVDGILLTHLHFDHVGGATRRDAQGRLVPAFPRAVHYVQKGELEDALQPNERTRASYVRENLEPLLEKKLVREVEGDAQVAEGIRLIVTGGHTRHHQAVLLQSQGRTAIFFADLVPTAVHLALTYIMGLDLYPNDTLAAKKRLLPQAFSEGWVVGFDHDPRLALARLTRENGRYRAASVEE
jgi:glyoxylase-like metal-dependent hydrolase (beta-lactamase superfamily II)